jgi:hypothetical protein
MSRLFFAFRRKASHPPLQAFSHAEIAIRTDREGDGAWSLPPMPTRASSWKQQGNLKADAPIRRAQGMLDKIVIGQLETDRLLTDFQKRLS